MKSTKFHYLCSEEVRLNKDVRLLILSPIMGRNYVVPYYSNSPPKSGKILYGFKTKRLK